MKALWTWEGKFFGHRGIDELWTHDGRHVGHFYGDDIWGKLKTTTSLLLV